MAQLQDTAGPSHWQTEGGLPRVSDVVVPQVWLELSADCCPGRLSVEGNPKG